MGKPLSCMLVTIQAADGVKRKIVNESPFTIGRSIESPIFFPEPSISRNHLLVKNKSGKIWICDEKSANGTFINGERMTPGRLTLLDPADIVRLGKFSAEITIQSIERAYTEDVLDEVPLTEDDHSSILNLVQGAHAEAARLVEAGKEISDSLIFVSEERARAIEQEMAQNREKMLRQSELEAGQIIETAKEERQKLIARSEAEAAEIKSALIIKAHDEISRTHAEAAKAASEATQHLENAKAERLKLIAAAESEATILKNTLLLKAQDEVSRMHAEAKRVAKQDAEEIMAEFCAKTLLDLDSIIEDISKLKPVAAAQRREYESLNAEIAQLQQKVEGLRATGTLVNQNLREIEKKHYSINDEVEELEVRRKELLHAKEDLTQRTEDAERDLQKRLVESKELATKDLQRQTQAMEEEIHQLRIVQMEQFKAERTAAVAEIIRDRERLTKKILMAIESSMVKFIPAETWRKVARETEEQIVAHLTRDSLTTDSGAGLTPMIAKATKLRRSAHRRWLVQGLLAGMVLVFASERIYDRVMGDSDPMKTAAEDSARQQQEEMERRRFDPPQDEELRATYAGSVVYTKDFVTNYLHPDFQKKWLKTASSYFLKQWHVQEESVVEAIATVNTLVKTLEERKQAIHPDYVKDGLKKMDDLESETMARVQELLGSEVRLEAFHRLEKSTFLKFGVVREPASSPKDPSTNDEN
ncbi:MAG: FHA domain-containing protein [Bdellovibrionales bacterium]